MVVKRMLMMQKLEQTPETREDVDKPDPEVVMARMGGYQREAKSRDLWCRFRQVILDMYLRILVVRCQWPSTEIGIDCPRRRCQGQGPRTAVDTGGPAWRPRPLSGAKGRPREGSRVTETEVRKLHPPGACESTGWLASPKRHPGWTACMWPDGRSLKHRVEALCARGHSHPSPSSP